MFKKAVLMVFATMLLIAGAGIASAVQVGGMQSGTGSALPAGLTVSVNPGGLGDSLIYGYYNSRDAFTFFRIVNTSTTDAVKARVRFREAKTSREILDFNVCLTNKDQWSAWIYSPTTNGAAVIQPTDGGLFPTSAVIPGEYNDSPAGNQTRTSPVWPRPSAGSNEYSPVAFQYEGTNPGVLDGVTADDTKEGYFEVIATTAKVGGTDTNDSHIAFTQNECDNAQSPVVGVSNVLGGNADIFVFRGDTGSGLFSYNATALADCDIQQDYDLSTEKPIWQDCFNGLNGVDYALTKQSHIAMYNVEDWDKAETEIILNFPTKGQHAGTKPFDTVDATTECEPVSVTAYNDLENTTTTITGFSPQGVSGTPVLCNEVNVIKVNSSDILNSTVNRGLDVSVVTPFTGLGWVRIGLDTGTINCTTGNSTCFAGVESLGLPSLGFVVSDYVGLLGAMDSTQYFTTTR